MLAMKYLLSVHSSLFYFIAGFFITEWIKKQPNKTKQHGPLSFYLYVNYSWLYINILIL